MNVNDGCSTSFTKEALNDIPAGAIDWLREHRVSLLMFSTWGLVPSIPVSTDSVSQATVPPDDMPLAPAEITPASAGGASSETTPRAAGNAFVERSDWRPLSVEQLPLPLLQHKALLQCLRARPEWAQHRVEIKYRKRSRGQDFYEVECLDGLDCCKRWRAFYIFSAHDMHPPGTLILQTCGEHSHETRRATSKLFTSQQLSIAEGFLASGGRDLRGLQLAFSTANIASNTLPNSTQLSNWLKRQKKSQKNTLSRHATLVEVTRLELTALPRSMPDTLSALFLLDEPVLTQDEVCIIFSCPGMVRHFERYQDTTLCCTVDAKMKVAEHGYGVATFGLLTRDKLRKTTLSRAARTDSTPARTQGFAFTSHTVPVVQAIFHQETHGNFQRLFRAVDKLWQNSASPPRPSLATLPFQLHKDFKKEIETARVDCFPHSRACDDFFHWSQKQHTTMAAKCCKTVLRKGKWVKEHLDWAVAAVRLLRLLPTLRLFSPLWAAYLRRLTEHGEHDLVAWLRTYERPLPFALAQQYASSSPPPTYVSFWTGFEGTVAGSGAGNQPAEALHAPWQRELQALGGKGNISHVLGVMQKLYTQHWEKWYDWHSSDPLRLSASAPRLLSVFFVLLLHNFAALRLTQSCHMSHSRRHRYNQYCTAPWSPWIPASCFVSSAASRSIT